MNTTINTADLTKRIVPITYARRRFGELEKKIRDLGVIILTKNGRPFVEMRAVEDKKIPTSQRLAKFAGCLKGTIFDDDKIVKEILTRKSRKKPVIL